MTKLYCWNVNGLRAVVKNGFLNWFHQTQPDVLCLQESKCHVHQIPEEIVKLENYHSYYSFAKRPGYSGVAVLSKQKPLNIKVGIELEHFDDEGRTLILEYPHYYLINSYYPNGRDDLSRVDFKLEYSYAVLKLAEELKKKKPVILCGDFNTAHHPIDLARPKENAGSTGFLPHERAFLDELVKKDFIDIFRELHPEPNVYSWWSYRAAARKRNVGWRIDYFFVDKKMKKAVIDANYCCDITGSDHCPLFLEINENLL